MKPPSYCTFLKVAFSLFFGYIALSIFHCSDHNYSKDLTKRNAAKSLTERNATTEDLGVNLPDWSNGPFPNNWFHKLEYRTLINNPDVCQDGKEGNVLLLVFICTLPSRSKEREWIRKNYRRDVYDGFQIKTVFVMGKMDATPSLQSHVNVLLQKENEIHRDLIQYDFVENYRNLTLKTLLGMRWGIKFCERASYALKADDDVIINYDNLADFLINLPKWRRKELYIGCTAHKTRPFRSSLHKWGISYAEYPDDVYPDYNHGPGYVLSMDAAKTVNEMSQTLPYMSFEDVFVGMATQRGGIFPVMEPRFFTGMFSWSSTKYSDYDFVYHCAFVLHGVTKQQMLEYMKDSQKIDECGNSEGWLDWFGFDKNVHDFIT